MERTLEITISVTNADEFNIAIREHGTGDHTSQDFPFSPDEHPELNEWIGNEIYGWLTYMMEEDES